jgi:hypothetical protein
VPLAAFERPRSPLCLWLSDARPSESPDGSKAAVPVLGSVASVAVPEVSVVPVLGSKTSVVGWSVASVVMPEVSVASVAVSVAPVPVAEVADEAADAGSMAIGSEDTAAPAEAGGGRSSA